MSRLTYDNRVQIRQLLDLGISAVDIAKELGVHHSSIYSELKRGGGASSYDPERAQQIAEQNRKKQNNFPIEEHMFDDHELARCVSGLILEDGLNIQQVVHWLETEGRDRFRRVPRSRATVAAAIDRGEIPGVTRETLRTKVVRLYSGDLLHIPQWVIEELGLCDGDEFSIEVNEREIILKKV